MTTLMTTLMAAAGSGLAGLFVVIPLAASLTVAATAHAQSGGAAQGNASLGPREVLLGTSTTPRNLNVSSTDGDALDIYHAAERELKLGRAEVAQRQLEVLVGRYPNAAIAAVARHDLIALIGRQEGLSVPQAALQLPTTPQPQLMSNLGAPAPTADLWRTVTVSSTNPATSSTGTSSTGTTKRLIRTAQDTFRQAAGDLVFFSDGSAELGARARRVLEAQAEWLQIQPGARVMIEGHADDSGGSAENMTLSDARAKAVQSRLIEAGIEPTRLSVVAAGRAKRVAECDDSACAAQNRRVATVIVAQSMAQVTEKTGLPTRNAVNPASRLPWETAPLPSSR